MDPQSTPPIDTATEALAGGLPADHLSMITLFLQADAVVKGVMILLALASVACWAVIIDKAVRLARLRRETRGLEAAIAEGGAAPLRGIGAIPDAIVAAGTAEWRDRAGNESRGERRERIERSMRAVLSTALRDLEAGLPFLATVGSAAPFIGLFGTVWGIMNSFTAIARSNDTSLGVVAPGIAEALFATAIGLVAAIPAVIAYNKLTASLALQSHRLGTAIATLSNRMARADLQPRAEVAE